MKISAPAALRSLLAILLLAAPAFAAPVVVPLAHDLLPKDPTVMVRVGEKEYPFLFDSGGGATIISPAIADSIGCKPLGNTVGFRSTGEPLSAKRCEDVQLKIGDYSATVDAGVGNIMQFFNEKTPQLGGMISLQTFEGHALTIDLAGNRLVVESDATLAERIRDMKPLRARLARQSGGAHLDLFIAAQTPHGRIWLEVDSGNTGPVFLSHAAIEQLGIDLDAPNGARVTKPQTIELIGFGPLEVGARERDIIYDGQLNYGALQRLVITVDLRTGQAWAQANKPAAASAQ